MEPGWWKVKVAWVLSAPPPALRSPRTAARPTAGEQALRRPASELARAADAPGPGPSCPYDRAGRRRALPSHGKRRPRGCGGPARLRRERAARRGSSEPIPWRAGRRRSPAETAGSGVLPIFASRLLEVPGAPRLSRLAPCSCSRGCGTALERGRCSPHCTEAHTEPPAVRREGLEAKALC